MGFEAQALLEVGRLVPKLEGGRPAPQGPLPSWDLSRHMRLSAFPSRLWRLLAGSPGDI